MTEVDDSDAPHASEMLRRYRFRRTRLYRWLRPPEPVLLNTRERRLPAAVKPLLFVGGAGATLPSDYISLDMTPYPGVTVVGNVEELPFATDSIGSASCDAVLEHVRRPQRAVDELFRVLKPGAYLHVGVPFCHPFHAYPSDYQRWTPEGLKELFHRFEIIDIGVRTGPTATMLTIFLEYIKLLTPKRFRRISFAIAGWLLWPLRYIDAWLMKRPDAYVLANNLYVLVRKSDG